MSTLISLVVVCGLGNVAAAYGINLYLFYNGMQLFRKKQFYTPETRAAIFRWAARREGSDYL